MSWFAKTDPVKGAKNIRKELKKTFPGIKFRVRSLRHGYGKSRTSIYVSTPDFISRIQVKNVIEKYAAHTGYAYEEQVKNDLSFQNKYGCAHHVNFENY